MNIVRDAIVATLKTKFPELGDSIRPFIGLMAEDTDSQLSYPSPGILVSAINMVEAPEDIAPWELRLNFGLVVTARGASALARDIAGWELSTRVAQVVYRNTWGVSQLNIRPAIFVGGQKNEARNPDGTPTGVNYWTILFYNWVKFEALLGD